MKASIQTKLLVMCVLLVLLATASVSVVYYTLTKQDKQRESQQRIQIAFEIIFDDLTGKLQSYSQKFGEFLLQDTSFALATGLYFRDTEKQMNIGEMKSFVISQLRKLVTMTSVDRVTLFIADGRLLAAYDNPEAIGGTSREPSEITFEGAIPEQMSSELFQEERRLGMRIIAPLIEKDEVTGIIVGETFFNQDMVERYQALSKTQINLFAGTEMSLGMLSDRTSLKSDELKTMLSCDAVFEDTRNISVQQTSIEGQTYYQGNCAIKNTQGIVGAISVNLSQEIEQQAARKTLHAILIVSAIVIGVAFGLSVFFSRRTLHSLHDIVTVIGAAAEGDLRKTATPMTRDEVGMLASKLNQMIGQLQNISGQVQGAAYAVNGTADTILQQMDALIRHMEQQSGSVDNTTNSMEAIHGFIDDVSRSTTNLLSAAAQILASIQETRASIAEVTSSTGILTTNLQNIFLSVDQVNQTVKHISEHTGHLEDVSQCTETEIHQIDQSLQDASQNADLAQQFAEETMQAANDGQNSVDASLEGMTELKDVVANTAQIIQEVNSWGERVSAILGIVDEITEQTSLLALNASIISAQAGTHGRGFAVVADEIKELATRTKTSTQEIGMLVHELQVKTEEGVRNTEEGLKKADLGMQLVRAVKDSLNTILERATHSSRRAADTAQLIQKTAGSSQTISTQITSVSEMVSKIRAALQEGEQDVEQIVVSVEAISGMSEQVNRANLEQKRAAEEIEHSMMDVTERFSAISEQTETLQYNANQIVSAMHTIESTTGQILHNATDMSGNTVKNLVQQSEGLQKIVRIFKVS